MTTACTVCARDQADTAYACQPCTDKAYRDLTTIAGLADAARDAAHGLVRYGPGTRRTDIDAPIPGNLAASTTLNEITTTLTTWTRHIADERGLGQPSGPDPLATAARWLATHLGWLRHQPYAAEAYDEIRDARRRTVRLADRPPTLALVGVCECGAWIYGRAGAAVVACRDCDRRWNVTQSRDTLRRAMDDKQLTAAQIATLAARAGHDRTRVRNLITVWARRGQLSVRGHADGTPTYRLGDALARLDTEPADLAG
ncbi:hypothetical protein CSH63_17855 [Micromonospora tulbaghiae]|uniref:Uncharacterized protein n=1 Tax=Micromonospora tulbaghiae TaxID=479978 RepID=A0A386WLS1_9ACTN|nr:hypothetical protein [Micromonospora tulbaghiae]AYF29296.1 hypothetical protein CSH63_17855 [Micromonospora tulbaghiae]